MAASHGSASHSIDKSDGRVNPVLGAVVCAAVIAIAFASLAIGLSGLFTPDPAGGLLRVFAGLVGFFVIFGLTLFAAARQK